APDEQAPAADAPASEASTPADVEASASVESASDASSGQASGQPGQSSGGEASRPGAGESSGGESGREDRKSWWERKKEKKKQKWLEKKQGRGGNQQSQHPPQPPPPKQVVHHGDLPDPARFEDLSALDALATEICQSSEEPLRLEKLYACTHAELTAQVRSLGLQIQGGGAPNRLQMLEAILKHAGETRRAIFDRGWIDLTDHGHGFIVHEHVNYRLYPEDAYLPAGLVRRYGLKRGHEVEVLVQAPQPGDRCPAVIKINSVMGGDPEVIDNLTPFEELEPYYPLKRILLEAPEIHKDISMRAIDLLTPVGFGQRG